jgi:hypothetical protein
MAKVRMADGTIEDMIPLQDMIDTVQHYLLMRIGRRIIIAEPTNQRQLNLLGKAYDAATKYHSRFFSFA